MGKEFKSTKQSGKKISLVKKSKKEGCKSKIQPGKKRVFVLHNEITVGEPIKERKMSNRALKVGRPLGYKKTTFVQNAVEQKDGSLLVETETSIYRVTFL